MAECSERAQGTDAEVSTAALLDKRQVAASFSRAATSYDAVAELQRHVGTQLLARLPVSLQPHRWLDLGSGTGYFTRALGERYGQWTGLAVDIAEGMLRHARPQGAPRTSSPVMPRPCRCRRPASTCCSPAWRCSGAPISRAC